MSLSDQGTRNPIPLTVDVPARLAAINQRKLRAYRLERLRAELYKRDYAGCLLADPINIRYATGSRNMTLWTMHAPSRWAFAPTQGPVVLYEFISSMHVNEGVETIAEMRPCTPWLYFLAGQRSEEKAMLWATRSPTWSRPMAARTDGSPLTGVSQRARSGLHNAASRSSTRQPAPI